MKTLMTYEVTDINKKIHYVLATGVINDRMVFQLIDENLDGAIKTFNWDNVICYECYEYEDYVEHYHNKGYQIIDGLLYNLPKE